MTKIRVSEKVKMLVRKKSRISGLSENEILELELFGVISKKK